MAADSPVVPTPIPAPPPPAAVVDVPAPPAQVSVGTQITPLDVAIICLVGYALILAGLHAQAPVLGIPSWVLAILDVLSPFVSLWLAVLRPLGSIRLPPQV